jgi:hypothetical protein
MQDTTALKEKLYDKFWLDEYNKLDWLSQCVDVKPDITETSQLAKKIQSPIDNTIQQKTFDFIDNHSNKKGAFFLWLIIVLILYTIRQDPPSGEKLTGYIAVLILLSIWAISLLNKKPAKQQITISDRELIFENTRYTWGKILGTYILKRKSGSSKTILYYLVLILKDERIVYHKLNNFLSYKTDITIDLSAYIEFYKNSKRENIP